MLDAANLNDKAAKAISRDVFEAVKKSVPRENLQREIFWSWLFSPSDDGFVFVYYPVTRQDIRLSRPFSVRPEEK
jgi:hypothetical protein